MWRAVPLALVLVGCPDAPLVAVPGGLVVRETSLTFGSAYVGASSQLTLQVVNESSAPHGASLELVGPGASGDPAPVFTADPTTIQIPGGGTASITLTFQPVAVGVASGTLLFVPDQGPNTQRLALVGTGLADLGCSTPPECNLLTFDPVQGQCLDTLIPDGTACADSCLTEGRCLQGYCIGQPLDCDDGNPCTLDGCEPGAGCIHTPTTANCPPPTDPCHVAACDPASGCSLALAIDGTTCGPVDCVTAHICIDGACQEQPVPEGALCGQETPCQPQGTCQGGVCYQADAGATDEAWEYDLDPSATLHWLALSDHQDDLYWAQHALDSSGNTQFELVSVSGDGYPRYTHPLGAYAPGQHPHDVDLKMMGLIHDPLVLVFGQPNQLVALNQSDGGQVWSVDFSELIARSYHPELFTGEDDIHVAQLVDDGDHLVVSLIGVSHSDKTDYSWGTWVRGISWVDGSTQWEWSVDGRSRRMVGDGFGNVYIAMWKLDSNPQAYFFSNAVTNFAAIVDGAVYALSPSGSPLWQHLQTRLLDIAADGNLLFVDQMRTGNVCLIDQTLEYAGAGSLAEDLQTQVPWASFVYDWPMLSNGLTYRLAIPSRTNCDDGATDAWLRAFDDVDDTAAWTFGQDLAQSNISAETLTRDGSVLFASADPDGLTANLRVVQPDGGEAFACPVVPFSVLTEPVLQTGRWIVGGTGTTGDVVISYQMPTTWVPASSGWTANRGNMQRTNRPQ